jgi:hypothetical protein
MLHIVKKKNVAKSMKELASRGQRKTWESKGNYMKKPHVHNGINEDLGLG